ncbi:MAG TPA: hypothetical protein ENN85_01710 [Methanoculleus sp.]|mgnify:CR=1 FL=1|nr:hypothetical protein [Methanoculleus sp.]
MVAAGHDREPLPWLILHRIIGIAVFLIVVVVLNWLAGTTEIAPVRTIAAFLTDNVWLVLLFSLIFLVADILAAFPFPVNIAAPFLNAGGAVLLVEFLIRIFLLVDTIIGITVFSIFAVVAPFLKAVVFVVVVITGLAGIVRPGRMRG